MGSKTYLNAQEHLEAKTRFAPARPANLRSSFHLDEPCLFSNWLGQKLESRLKSHPLWQESRPFRLGSWARGELCAKSDIDLLFVGNETAVAQLVGDFQSQGLKIRARVPSDPNDWSAGLDIAGAGAFDVLALLSAIPFFAADQRDLSVQLENIAKGGARYRKTLFKAMMKERAERAKRYDSIANFLEPNLKHGPGGLRDLEQGLLIAKLFPEIFAGEKEVLARLKAFKSFFLEARHWLHLEDGTDVLLGSQQADLARFLGYESAQKFMSDLESGLSEVSFYADWISERARPRRPNFCELPVVEAHASFESALKRLVREPGLLAQKDIRSCRLKFAESKKRLGRTLERTLHGDTEPKVVDALFRSQFLAQLLPDLARVTGHVQFDQYHRYSVDAHTHQAVREVLRVKDNPKQLGQLASLCRELTREDWLILVWSALFHDLGKGLAGDQSLKGTEIVKRELTALGVSLNLTRQVAWMVQNHLLLSGAAFRRNPQDPALWAELFSRGVKGRRIARLAIFTAIDIRATNRDAWNDWKSQLLSQLVNSLTSPSAHSFGEFLDFAASKKIPIARDWLDRLDPLVVERVPRASLLQDYRALSKAKHDLPPLVLKNRAGEIWIRFHAHSDRPGLFLQYSRALYANGINVVEAFVQTYANYGVYDWFRVKSTRPLATLRSQLAKLATTAESVWVAATPAADLAQVQFASVELISDDERSAILSFRGRDQKGALLAAAQLIYSQGLEIQAAKVHTWGRQIEDIFTLKKAAPDDRRFSVLLTP